MHRFESFSIRHKLPKYVTKRVQRYIHEIYGKRKGIDEAIITKDFAQSVKGEVMTHMLQSLLSKTVYFSFLDDVTTRQLAEKMTFEIYVIGDYVSMYGEPGWKLVKKYVYLYFFLKV